MSNVSIYEKNWIDLVFEDKNKAYGAYQLRQENPRTTLIAFFSGILFLFSLFGLWLLFSSFDKKPDEIIINCPLAPTIKPVDLEPRKEPVKPKVTTQSSSAATPNKFKKLVVAQTPTENIDVPKNTDIIPETTPTMGQGTGTGIESPNNGGGSSVGTAPIPVKDNSPKTTNELDRLPEYPGGMKKFYEYVGNNINKADVDDSLIAISVIMSFVIEKDGSMTDIKVLRSSDKNLEREAIRVLKALKIRWSPGFKDGEKVRVLYTLPIKVTL
jgi:protein TonB